MKIQKPHIKFNRVKNRYECTLNGEVICGQTITECLYEHAYNLYLQLKGKIKTGERSNLGFATITIASNRYSFFQVATARKWLSETIRTGDIYKIGFES